MSCNFKYIEIYTWIIHESSLRLKLFLLFKHSLFNTFYWKDNYNTHYHEDLIYILKILNKQTLTFLNNNII